MSTLNLSDTEQRVEIFQSRLRTDYAAKIQEVAKLTDVVAKLQTQLLDVEHENNVLRQQLVISKKRIDDLEKGTGLASEKENQSVSTAGIPTVRLNPSLKRERSPSLEILDVPQPSSKKAKRKQREQNSATSTDVDHRPTSTAKVQTKRTPAASESDSEKETDEETRSNSPKSFVLDSSSCIKVQPGSTWKEQLKHTTALTLPESLVNAYLREVHSLKISPRPIDLKLSQAFLAMNYGGCRSTSLLLGKFTKNNPSGSNSRRRCFALLSRHPDMPTRPGNPGLFSFNMHHAPPLVSLFCSWSQSYRDSEWLYLGEYEFSFVGKMSAECFRMQSSEAKKVWARQIQKIRRFADYRVIRARIALRSSSSIPLDDKQEEKTLIEQEMAMIKKGHGLPVSEDDIISAYSNGEEEVNIFRVRCVKYDYVFANDIEDRFHTYTPPEKSNKGKKEIEEGSDSGSNEEDDSESDSDSDTPPPAPESTSTVSKKQNKSNVRALVKNLQGKKPNIRPVASVSSDSE